MSTTATGGADFDKSRAMEAEMAGEDAAMKDFMSKLPAGMYLCDDKGGCQKKDACATVTPMMPTRA